MPDHKHFKLYKPAGYLSQFVYNERRRRNKKLLSDLGDFPDGLMSVGRLDEKSEGLLFLTTDGRTSHKVRSKSVEKEYYVQLDGIITEDAVVLLEKGVEITIDKEKYSTLPSKTFILTEEPNLPQAPRKRGENHGPTSWISITITEGKFRQVRRMTAAVGFPTIRLVRVRIGQEKLENLLPGESIQVSRYKL
ncbi:MAG: pseudouridine synthase [Bacteroidia bacterium]